MDPEQNKTSGKHSHKRILLSVFVGIVTIFIISGIFIYKNFNRLLSEALMKSFNSSIVSDVYDLEFSDLSVNFSLGNIRVKNVEILPKKVPLKNYPYINSSLELRTKEILLANVEIKTLLKQNKLKLERINIENPEVLITVAGKIPIFLPFNESKVELDTVPKSSKSAINAYSLENFNLTDASVHIVDLARARDLEVARVYITISDLRFDQQPGKDLFSYSLFYLNVGKVEGLLRKESVRQISLKDYEILVNSLEVEKSIDTLIYHFDDIKMGLKGGDIHAKDSIFHLTFQNFNLSYNDKSVTVKNVTFSPNLSEKEIQKMHKFQTTQFQGSAAHVKFSGINFDSLLYHKKIFIDEILIDSVNSNIFKDKTKPLDLKHFPEYPGQLISSIKTAVLIKQVLATNVNLAYEEIKPDKNRGKANINKAILKIENITNIDKSQPLLIKTDAFLENKAHFNLNLDFDYYKPEFNFNGTFSKFNLKDLNSLIQSFTPASINNGIAEKIEFNGIAKEKKADGTMKFLYNDLNFNVNLENQAAWKNSVVSFAANAVVTSSNPASEVLPPRIVKYHVERDMNKAFINLTLISVLEGLKQTVFMSKENKKQYKQVKKEARKEIKESTN
jgi:hypothetical protein